MASEEFLNELEYRLRTLHERPVLIGAGIVTEGGHYVKGDRTEEPMSDEAIKSILASKRGAK